MKWKKEEEEWRPATWICRFLTHISARFSLFRQIRANSARIKKKKKRDSPQIRMQLRQWPHGAPMRVWCRCGAPEATPVLPSIEPTMCLQLILSLQPPGCTLMGIRQSSTHASLFLAIRELFLQCGSTTPWIMPKSNSRPIMIYNPLLNYDIFPTTHSIWTCSHFKTPSLQKTIFNIFTFSPQCIFLLCITPEPFPKMC